MAGRDELTTDDLAGAPARTAPVADSPPVSGIEDRAEPAERSPNEPGTEQPKGEQPVIMRMSPKDEKRAQIMRNSRRSEQADEQEGMDDIPGVDMEVAVHGEEGARLRRAQRGEQEAADDIAAADQHAEETGRAPDVSHGGKQTDIIVNGQMISVPWSTLRQVLIENNEDPTGLPDNIVKRSAQMILAARDRLAAAKKKPGEQQAEEETQDTAVEQRPQESIKERLGKAVEQIQYGDVTKGTEMLGEIIANVALNAADHVTKQRETSRSVDERAQSVNGVMEEFGKRDDWKGVVQRLGPNRVGALVLAEGQEVMAQELAKFIDPSQVQLMDHQTRVNHYNDLRSRGAALLSEADITRRAHEGALQTLGARREAPKAQQTAQHAPAVDMSRERVVRRQAVSQQPRAASNVSQTVPQRGTSDVIARMAAQRPR